MHFFKIAKNTLYQSIAKLFSSFIGFLITIIIARSFGVLGYGDFIKITSFVAPFYLFVDFGLNAFYLQLKKEEENYSRFFSLRLFLALLVFILINLINIFLPYNEFNNIGYSPVVKFGIFLFSISLFSQAIIYSSSAIFQKRLKYFYYMLSILLGSAVNLVLVLFFTKMQGSITYVILAFVISGILTALFTILFAREKISSLKLNIQFSKKLIGLSFPLALMLIFNLVYFRIDAIILTFLKSTKDVGVYGLSFKFFDFLIALPLFLSNSLYPILLQNQKNLRKLKLIIKNYSFVFIFSGIFLIIPFWFLSLLFSFINKDFLEAVLPFRILLFSLPFFFISSFFQWVLIAFKKQKFLMFVYLLTSLLNILLNLIFIPKYSYLASATITIISEALIVLILLVKLINTQKILEKDYKYE